MTNSIVNIAASVRQRLLNFAKEQQDEFQQVLIRYALERLLFRLSLSEHADRFVLKGALLFRLLYDIQQRPTRDADFLGFGSAEPKHLEALFKEVAGSKVAFEDGLVFDVGSVKAEEIKKDAEYPGVRITMFAELAAARIPVQCDVGFGDIVVTPPSLRQYPTLLEMPAPVLMVYPFEAVVGEKLEALVKLGRFNSRMKDYFDLWILMRHEKIDVTALPANIRATFERRGTALPEEMPVGLTDTFSGEKQQAWEAFVRRSTLSAPPLKDVVAELRKSLWPLLEIAGRRNPWI